MHDCQYSSPLKKGTWVRLCTRDHLAGNQISHDDVTPSDIPWSASGHEWIGKDVLRPVGECTIVAWAPEGTDVTEPALW